MWNNNTLPLSCHWEITLSKLLKYTQQQSWTKSPQYQRTYQVWWKSVEIYSSYRQEMKIWMCRHVSPWSMTSQLQSFVMARCPLTGSRVSLSASTRERGTHWKGATTVVSSWHSRFWKSWRGFGRPPQTVGVNRRFPAWFRPRQRHYRCNLCCQAAAREVSSCQQETLHGFRRSGEGVWSSTSEGHLVGAEITWCGGVDCATGAGDVCKCMEPCPCWWGVQWRVWSEGWCSPRISTQPTALHHSQCLKP